MSSRIADLERRVMLLEARLRRTAAEVKAKETGKPVRMERQRPRCPGCLLELPKGRKGETCVWCGFVFAAVETPRRRSGASKAR